MNSLALSLFYCPALTSIHDYWKIHSFGYTDLCPQSDFLAFNVLIFIFYSLILSWTPLPPPSPYHPSGSSQRTSPEHPVSCIKPISWLFNTLSRFVIASAKKQSFSNLLAEVTIRSDFRAQEEEICHCFHLSPFYLPSSDGVRCHDLCFWILSFKPAFSLSSFTYIKRLFSSCILLAIRVVSLALSEVIDISPGNLDSSLCFIQPSVSHDILCT